MSDTDAESQQATGTLIRVNHGYSRYTWHHSVSFDGYVHETACGQSIDTGVETVIMDLEEWENLDGRECCDECAGSVRSLIEDWDGLHEKYEVYEDGDRVEDCFVLEPTSDHAARAALIEYAEATDNEDLAQDLRDWVVDICTEDEQLATDGGVNNHSPEAPDFEFDEGQSFKLANESDPEEYWYVKARVWNYDADTDDALVQLRAYKQYLVGEVSTLGGDERLVTEDTLMQHYEPVEKEEAKEVLQA